MSNTNRHSINDPFLGVLKRVVLQRNPGALAATRKDVHKTLQFFEVPKNLTPILRAVRMAEHLPCPTQEEFESLMRTPMAEGVRISLDKQVRDMVAQLLASPNRLKLVYPDAWQQMSAQSVFEHLLSAATTVPGQTNVATALACDLAQQLAAPERRTAARLLIHGEPEITQAMVQALTQSLHRQQAYAVLDIDCTNYRSEGEAASWTGAKSYWRGSGPGEITAFIHRHPRAVVVLHHLDKTLPSVMASIRDAFTRGQLVDSHGIATPDQDERPGQDKSVTPTQVDCSQTVFIATVSLGHEWLVHPHNENVLGIHAQQRQQQMLGQLQTATREHRGDNLAVFESAVLQQLADHHHVLTPLSWSSLQSCTRHNLPSALANCVQKNIPCEDLAMLADLALWSHGGRARLRHTQASALLTALLGTQIPQLWAQYKTQRVQGLSIQPEVRTAYHDLQIKLGHDPLREWQRWGQYLRLNWTYDPHTAHWVLQSVHTDTVRNLDDYTGGSNALRTHIPNETLASVAGHPQAKAYLQEVITHLRNPHALQAWGVQAPKGVLLYGPPGTGKTLLARALAGEAGLPFLSITGTELCDTQALQRLYAVACRNAPCLVHIDEADALGQRGQSTMQDRAINLLLAHIDGFEQTTGIFHVLTTNRPEAIDAALTRPGRIDRKLEIGPLDASGRRQALTWLWARMSDADTDAAQNRVLQLTYGMTGADMAQLQRELSMRQVREQATHLPLAWVLQEISRLQWGDIHTRHSDDSYRRRVAVHEAGHALLQHLLLPQVPIAQVSITPRAGNAGFVASNFETAHTVEETPAAVRAYITTLLGGRAAEVLHYGTEGPSNGAANDLARASEAAFKAVAFGGLDAQWGSMSLAGLAIKGHVPARWQTRAAERVRDWINQCEREALLCLRTQKQALSALVEALLLNETLDGDDVARIVHSAMAECAPPWPVASSLA